MGQMSFRISCSMASMIGSQSPTAIKTIKKWPPMNAYQLLILFPALVAFAEPPPPQWIWSANGDRMSAGAETTAQRVFVAEGEIERATLRATADFAALTVSLNGKAVLRFDPYDPPAEVDVSRLMVKGKNTIVATATGVDGPSALAVSLEIVRKGAEPTLVGSDATWKGVLRSQGAVDLQRWGLPRLPDVSPFSEYNQWMEAKSGSTDARLSPLPPGFEIVKIRDAQPNEDTWISLTFDPKGRIIIGKEQKGLLRLTLSSNRNEVVSSETIEDTLKECRGLAWKGNDLYAHANNSKAVYRLRDTDGDDRLDEVTQVLATKGDSGHGRNALTLGPDGAVHAITGDDVLVPATSLRRTRPEPQAPNELGHWARYSESADGTATWETFCRGLRNPYGIDFNGDGEAFTYDADHEADTGLPYYRPTRINHLVSGANYGWHQDRQNQRSLPVHAPDTAPTTFDVGRGSPTGVRFGARSHFPSPWKEALFALDWAYGRIVAVHLTPNGASYTASGVTFLEGRPLNVTDLVFDADGAMWFVTGGRKTQASLYRVRYTGQKTNPAPVDEQAQASAAFSKQARELRKRLERFHGKTDLAAVDELWPHLDSADPWIRTAARVALEWQPLDTWRERALAADAGLTAKLALARAGSDADRAAMATALPSFTGKSRTEKLTSLRIREWTGSMKPIEKPAVDASDAVNRELALALAAIGSPDAVSFALERLASATEQMERLHYIEALAETKSGWTTTQRDTFFTTLAHARRFSSGDRMMPAFFQALEKSALANVEDSATRERFAKLLAEEPVAEPMPAQPARSFVQHWSVADLEKPDASAAKPDLKRGRELFTAMLCARCHVCGNTGRPMGPDLTTVARRFSRRDLIESIVEPSKVIAEVHQNVIVTKTDGSLVMGRVIQNNFRESKLVLAINPFAQAESVTLSKSDIKNWEPSPVSPMPPALLDTLSRAEIEDLLAFILNGGSQP